MTDTTAWDGRPLGGGALGYKLGTRRARTGGSPIFGCERRITRFRGVRALPWSRLDGRSSVVVVCRSRCSVLSSIVPILEAPQPSATTTAAKLHDPQVEPVENLRFLAQQGEGLGIRLRELHPATVAGRTKRKRRPATVTGRS